MKTRLLFGGIWFCGETIVPERLAGLQLSFNFTIRIKLLGGNFMKRVIAVLVILASILSLAACKELTPEEKMSSIAAEDSKNAVERSEKESVIAEGKKDILDEIGKTKKDERIVIVRKDENNTEFRVVIMDKNGFGKYMEKYIFYSVEAYKIAKNQESFGADIPVKKDDDLRMIKFKREFENDATYESFLSRYENSSVWEIVK